MADVNHVILIGRLTRDAELKYTSGGQPVCKFDIAVNRKKKSGDQYVDEASFFTVVLWGKAGESLNQYLTKGKQVAVEGELRQDRWEQDGQARSKVEIQANNVQLLGGGQGDKSGQGSTQSGQDKESHQESRPYAPRAESGSATGDGDGFADDIPFN